MHAYTINTCILTYAYICMISHTFKHVPTPTLIHMHTPYTRVHTYAFTHEYTLVSHSCTHACIHTYTHTQI